MIVYNVLFAEKELHKLHELSEKKHQLLETLGFNQKDLQEIQKLVAIQSDSFSGM